MGKKRKVSNAKLVKLYWVDGMSCAQVARQTHMSKSGVRGRLKYLGIRLRSRSEWLKLRREREREFLINKFLSKYLKEPEDLLEAADSEEGPASGCEGKAM